MILRENTISEADVPQLNCSCHGPIPSWLPSSPRISASGTIRYELTYNLDQSRWGSCLPTDFRLAIPWIAISHDMRATLRASLEHLGINMLIINNIYLLSIPDSATKYLQKPAFRRAFCILGGFAAADALLAPLSRVGRRPEIAIRSIASKQGPSRTVAEPGPATHKCLPEGY